MNQSYSTQRIDSEADALGIALVASARVWKQATLFARAGVARTRLDQAYTSCLYHANSGFEEFRLIGCFTNSNLVVNETRPVAGLGLDWPLARGFAVRASWDRYFGVGTAYDLEPLGPRNDKRGEYDIDYFGVGVTFAF